MIEVNFKNIGGKWFFGASTWGKKLTIDLGPYRLTIKRKENNGKA